jgi:methyl-accepting chemotaxis protein
MTEKTITRGRRRIGVRGQILAVGAAGMAAAVAVGGFAISGLGSAGDSLDEVSALEGAASFAQTIQTYNADVSGWQIAYAWDARRVGAAEAVQLTEGGNRAGFLDVTERLRAELAKAPTQVFTGEERALAEEIDGKWDDFFALDDQAAALYAQDTPATTDAADALILDQGFGVYYELIDLTNALRDSLDHRVEQAHVAAEDEQARTTGIMIGVIVLGAVLVLGIAFMVARRITRPLGAVMDVATALAAGDLTKTSGVTQDDEVGRTAAALDEAIGNLREVMTSVVGSADAVAASSEELSASSAQISASAEETSAQSGVVSSAAEEVSRNVQTVAAGAEQMGASIREIASNAAEASDVAARAVVAAGTTTATVAKLGESSAEIGNVVKVITSIAEQTNLLALNATIEAARAGEAGKGFAVVANEVKELAQETAKATEDVSRRIQAIQADSGQAVQAIEQIGDTVGRINDLQSTIAAAVEQQTAAAAAIDRNIGVAAQGSHDIAAGAEAVAGAAETSAGRIDESRGIAEELVGMASDLQGRVAQFTV